MYCKDCEHWSNPENGYGKCLSSKFKYHEEMSSPPSKKDKLLYCDYECYRAFFRTGAKFGCIHFEPAKTSTPFGLVD